jgi:hypothetical protein
MLHLHGRAAPRVARWCRTHTVIVAAATWVATACDDQSHPPFIAPCGPLDSGLDAGADAGPVTVVSCGDPGNVKGVPTAPGGPGTNGGGGTVDVGIGGSGAGIGGTGAATGIGGTGAATGIGGNAALPGIGGGATGLAGSPVGVGMAGTTQIGVPGIGGIGP